MTKRMKNIFILIILFTFLLFVANIPVTCIFKYVTGISCPACGMTRAFLAILNFDLYSAFLFNILSIPLFCFLVVSTIVIFIEIIQNKFIYVPKLLQFLGDYWYVIVVLLIISFLLNNYY